MDPPHELVFMGSLAQLLFTAAATGNLTGARPQPPMETLNP